MPFVYYDSVNGHTVSEVNSGIGTDYLVDALGSITATVDQSSQVLNIYRYKPYGTQLSKQGNSFDPKYLFTGDTGSRTTSMPFAEQYNLTRHFSPSIGRWNSIDPTWPVESAYTYCASAPTVMIDPEGLAPIITRTRLGKSVRPGCGTSFTIKWKFSVSEKVNGWIIQHIVRNFSVAKCETPFVPETLRPECYDYFEAWPVVGGQVLVPYDFSNGGPPWGPVRPETDGGHDTWKMQATKCQFGSESILGVLYFVNELPSNFRRGSNYCADDLPATQSFDFIAQLAPQISTLANAELGFGCCKQMRGCPPKPSCQPDCKEGPCSDPKTIPAT